VALVPGQTIEQSLATSLSGRRILLILDNCEHVIDAAAALTRKIVEQCGEATVLATSREALMADGERIFPVPSLGVGDGSSPAVELFIDRARALAADLDVERDESAIREICRRLDGIPLAIELAAARTRTISPAQIREKLDDRFRLLTGGMRGALDRHQTLRQAVQWSYDLLSPAEQALLARASTFAGGFSVEAAEKVCAGGVVEAFDVLDLLDSLVRKSLMTVERSGAVMRYGLLETIRQFAEERRDGTGEAESARLRHAEYFAEDSDVYFQIWRSSRQAEAHDWLDREMDNLRFAFAWAKGSGEIDIAVRIASNVGDMARFRLRDEAAAWPEQILEAARAARHRRLAILLTWAASAAWSFGELDKGRRFGEEAIALVGEKNFDPFVWAFTDLALIALMSGDPSRAVEFARAGAAHKADRRDRMCLVTLLYILCLAGHADEARTMADEVVAAAEAAGVPSAIALAWLAKAEALAESDQKEALRAYERAAFVARQSGAKLFLTVIIPKLAATLLRLGDAKAALLGFREMLESSAGSRDFAVLSQGLGNLVVLFERLGRPKTAAILNEVASRILGNNAFVPELAEASLRVSQALGKAALEAASTLGATMSASDANAFALAEISKALEPP
jgi:predicted ATPase